jgi:CHAT domain-containing protein/tetratricopeptide (TPR) repeat protein
MAGKNHEQSVVRSYLLRQLSASEQETMELRLLSEEALSEELDIVEDELIDEYLSGELSAVERKRFEEAFLAYPERERKLKAAEALRRHFENTTPKTEPARVGLPSLLRWWSPAFSSPVGVSVVLLVFAGIGLIVWRGFYYQSDLEKGLLALNEAYRRERPVEARISNLNYAPFISRRDDEPAPVDTFERDRAQRFLSDAFKKSADADSHHALGKFYLSQRELEKAIQYLEQARSADPDNAQVYADLGAAYLERSKSYGTPPDGVDPGDGRSVEDLGRSLEYLKQALELDPNLLEALFNRGLVHRYQKLYQQAEADWRLYLEKDQTSQWAEEARQQLKLIEQEKGLQSQKSGASLEAFLLAYRNHDDEAAWGIYTRSYTMTGNQVTNGLIDHHLQSTEYLDALRYLGELEIRKTRDSYTSDLAKFYASASRPVKARTLEARQQVHLAYKLFSESKISEATDLFQGALVTFQSAGNSAESLAVESAMAHGAAVQPDIARGQQILARVIPACEANNYLWLLAQALTDQAHLESNLNNYSQAISYSTRGLQLFQQLNDVTNALGNLNQLASLYLFLNDTEMSFSFLRRATEMAHNEGASPGQIWGLHIATSLNLSALKLYRAALDYQQEALQLILALPRPVPLYISRSYQYIGLTYGSLGRFDLAVQNVRQAYEQGKTLAVERIGQNMMANASLKLGDLYRASGDLTSALAAYDESLRIYEALGFAHYSYAAHKGKFLSYLTLNDDALAARELSVVLQLSDDYREKIVEERQKTRFFDREQDTYDLAIDFTYDRLRDARRAFDYSEICRARNLRELVEHGAEVMHSHGGLDLRPNEMRFSKGASLLDATEIQRQMPEQVQIVQYAMLEKKLVIWVITPTRFFTKPVEVEASKLSELVTTALRQINQRDQAGATASLRSLHSFLVEPIKEELDRNKVLCFIPDKFLHYVPFAALVTDSLGRFLIQDFRVMTSPSASILIHATNRAKSKELVKEEHLLALGNPIFDRKSSPGLADLPAAEREVVGIAGRYASRQILVRDQASRKLIMAELSRADVAHFAAHYVVDPTSSLSSRLVLGPEPGDSANALPPGLRAADIYQMNLARTRLVVLSGCKTGIEQQFAGEGPIGFARSFLVAGVPVVVASLWPVDSDATAELMISFHRFRKVDRLSTTEALTRAQQEMISRSPYYWAGFTVVGGYADF